jgi:hypothetical protein
MGIMARCQQTHNLLFPKHSDNVLVTENGKPLPSRAAGFVGSSPTKDTNPDLVIVVSTLGCGPGRNGSNPLVRTNFNS